MNRFWLGVGILLGILLLGIFCAASTEKLTEVSGHLTQAAAYAEAGQWEQAQNRFLEANKIWEKSRSGYAAITDHAPMEEIDQYFAQGQVFLAEQSGKDFRVCCQRLSLMVAAVADAQDLNWWSLL